MKTEYMLQMSPKEVDDYAKLIGVDVTDLKTKKAKVERIQSARQRTADISVLGMEIHVPIRIFHDKRLSDRLRGQTLDDEGYEQLVADIIGREQSDALVERCTDDDGLVDVDALGVAMTRILYSTELKNF